MVREAPIDVKRYLDGIGRRKKDKKFIYFYIKNNKPISKIDQKRINKLHIPPAWTDVWISTDRKSSIQAVGLDNKGKKQYIYHDVHIKIAEQRKFLRLMKFIKAIPKLEYVLSEHTKLNPYEKERVIATMLAIVKLTHMRVGKEQYVKKSKSYGISSLRKKHIKIDKDKVRFDFKGKSRKRLRYVIKNKYIRKHLRLLLRLDGDRLFQYVDNKIRRVTDVDLNNYIRMYMGEEFTIKDFRTYAANWHFIRSILSETRKRTPKNRKIIKKNILNAIKRTAFYLKHTKAISKKSYIMDFAIDLYNNNPDYFIKHKNDDPNDVLMDLLKKYNLQKNDF